MDDIVLNLDLDAGVPPRKSSNKNKGGRWVDRSSFFP